MDKMQVFKRRRKISQELIVGTMPLKALLAKSKNRVELLGWAKNEEEAERLIAEEEKKENNA